jgi:hypothetical protein
MLNSQTNRTTSELDRFEDKDLNFGRLLIAKPGVNYNINEIEAHYNFKKIKLLYRDYDEVLYCFRLTHLRHFFVRNRLFPPFWQSKIYKTL